MIKAGADLNVKAKNGETCLFDAVRGKKYEMVELLIEKGIDINLTNFYDDNALKTAVSMGSQNINIVRLLLESKINPNLKSIHGETPLHEAVRQGNAQLVKLLLQYKADPSIKDDNGKTAADWAESRKMDKITILFK